MLTCADSTYIMYRHLKASDGSVCVEAPGGFPFYVVDKDRGDQGTVLLMCTYIWSKAI